jgi:hypothetical protein
VNPDRLNDPSVQRFAKTVETTPDYPDGIDVLMVHEDPGEFPGSRHVNIVWEIAWTDKPESMRTLLTNAVIWASPDHIGSLIDMVAGMDIHAGIKNSLLAKLSAACNALGRGQIHTAINGLNAFINEVEAQKGKKLTDEQAEILMGAALTAIGSLSDGASPAPSKHGGIELRGKLSAVWGKIKEN